MAGEFRPNLKQTELWQVASDPEAEIILMDGAIRTGKSQSCGRLQVAWALETPGTTHWAMRKTQRELDDTTKKQYLYGDGNLEPIIPPECLIVHNESKDTAYIRCPGGGESEIVFRALETRKGASDADSIRAKIRGTTLASVFIDQAEEFDGESDEETFYELLGRLSDPRGPNKMILCSNPGSKGHWLWKLAVNPATRDSNVRYVHVELADNKHNLAPGYWQRMESLKTKRRTWWRRFVKGEWGVSGGVRFPMLDESRHVIAPFPIDPKWPIIEGLDYGSKNPTAYLIAAIAPIGRWYVVGEHYEGERSLGYHAEKILALRESVQELRGLKGPFESDEAWWDPSMWARRGDFDSVALELMDYGIDGAKAQNERRGGWVRLEKLLGEDLEDGLPGIQFFSPCVNVWNELGGLKYKPGTDDTEKEHDHAADALRYMVMSRAEPPKEENHDEEKSMRERYLAQMRQKMSGAGRVQIPGGSYA